LLVVIETPDWAMQPAISVREAEGSPFERLLFGRRQGRLVRRRLTLR